MYGRVGDIGQVSVYNCGSQIKQKDMGTDDRPFFPFCFHEAMIFFTECTAIACSWYLFLQFIASPNGSTDRRKRKKGRTRKLREHLLVYPKALIPTHP
jgi:hypothetical protein